MDADNFPKYNVNASFAFMQSDILEMYKASNPNLSPITCINNILSYNGINFELGRFRLNQLNPETCRLDAHEFFFLIKIMADVENNINEEDYYLFNIEELFNKMVLTELEKEIIKNFIDRYNLLLHYKPHLIGIANKTLNKYQQLINRLNKKSINDGITLLNELVTYPEDESLNRRGNGKSRILTNPDFPNIAPDEEQPYSKTGFISILLILYSIINAAIILAIQLLK